MFGRDRPLDNPINWSFRAGRLFAIDIRVHIVFVICAVVLVWMEVKTDDGFEWSAERLAFALGTYAILFGIVLLHEFGHCYGARRTGGRADEILIWPLGGLASVQPPHRADAYMITTLAGPAVNVILCAICSAVLVAWMGSLGAVPWNPLHPFEPVSAGLIPTAGQEWVLRVYGLSYFLLLINLLPIFPFDGGRVVQAWLWPRKGFAGSMEIATSTGMVGAVIIGLFALFTEESWILLMIAVFGYMTCWQTRRVLREHGEFAVEGAGGEFSPSWLKGEEEERRPGWFERRRQARLARKAQREREQMRAHERAVEEVLKKVSQTGMGSLTARERKTLERETERKRMLNP